MTRAAGAAIALIARTLPPTVRERHREEWLADLAAASENGIRPASIVAGAATFSILLDRSVPDVAGFAVPQLARRHAQWALAIAGLTVLVVQSRLLTTRNVAWLPIALVLTVMILCHLWAAARLSAGAGRAAATFATAGLAGFAAASTVPIVVSVDVPGSRILPVVAAAFLVVAFLFGLAAWGRSLGATVIVLLAAGAGLAGALGMGVLPASALFSPTLLTVVVLTVVAIAMFVRSPNSGGADARRARNVIGWFGIAGLLAIGYELSAQLVLNAIASAPGQPLEQIYASIPERTLSIALGDVIVVAALSLLAVVAYLVVSLAVIRRGRGDTRGAIAAGAALVALVLVANSAAGQALTSARWREFGLRSSFSGDLTQELLSLAAAVAVVALIAPRSRPATAARAAQES